MKKTTNKLPEFFKKCPECKSEKINLKDKKREEYQCEDCGLIIKTKLNDKNIKIIDPKSWTTY